MKISTIRTLILTAITLLAVSEALDLMTLLVGNIGGFIGGVVVAAVYIACGRMARAGVGYHGWIILPTFLFVVLPLIYQTWHFFTSEGKSLAGRLMENAPFLLSFVIPMILLVFVYFKLAGHVEKAAAPADAKRSIP
jgi:hypothetical protein